MNHNNISASFRLVSKVHILIVKYISTSEHTEPTDFSICSADSENKQCLRFQEVFSQVTVQKEFPALMMEPHFKVTERRPATSSKEDSVTNVFPEIFRNSFRAAIQEKGLSG